MPDKRQKYDEKFKTNAVQLSYVSSKTFLEVANGGILNFCDTFVWGSLLIRPSGQKNNEYSNNDT